MENYFEEWAEEDMSNRDDPSVCTGPYCLPVYKDGKPTGKVECPADCSLCGINGDSY